MEPIAEPLRMYGSVSPAEPLGWPWVQEQLETAGTYWVLACGDGHPHPRPVWGFLADDGLRLSLGSPVVNRQLAGAPEVTVHLDSGTDVVILEGIARKETHDESAAYVEAYDTKYDYPYDLDQYGPFMHVRPTAVLAWRAAGEAGRDGFTQVGRWRFD